MEHNVESDLAVMLVLNYNRLSIVFSFMSYDPYKYMLLMIISK